MLTADICINYVNKLDGSLSALHIQSLGGVASLYQLAGDGVEGPRALVQLLDGVELQGLCRVVDQEGVGLDIIRMRVSESQSALCSLTLVRFRSRES